MKTNSVAEDFGTNTIVHERTRQAIDDSDFLKGNPMSTMHCSLLSLGCIFGFAASANRTTLTALRAFKVAQRRLRPEVRAKLLSVSSARTDGSLTPDAWRFVFLDPATSGNSRVVTVAAKTSSEHPDTVEAFGSAKVENVASSHPMAQNKWMIDSHDALVQARGAAKLKGIRSAEYGLSQAKNAKEPVWTLTFYAESPDPVARLHIGAKTGSAKITVSEKDEPHGRRRGA